jgi:hypothetical protein
VIDASSSYYNCRQELEQEQEEHRRSRRGMRSKRSSKNPLMKQVRRPIASSH